MRIAAAQYGAPIAALASQRTSEDLAASNCVIDGIEALRPKKRYK